MFKVTDKLRLWLGYALLAALLGVAALAIYNYTERLRLGTTVATLDGQVKAANTQLAAVAEANEQQQRTLERVRLLSEANDTALTGLAQDLQALQVRNHTTLNRLRELERTNEKVREYLSAPVPAELACLLDATCPPSGSDGGGAGAAARGVAAPVPRPVASAHH